MSITYTPVTKAKKPVPVLSLLAAFNKEVKIIFCNSYHIKFYIFSLLSIDMGFSCYCFIQIGKGIFLSLLRVSICWHSLKFTCLKTCISASAFKMTFSQCADFMESIGQLVLSTLKMTSHYLFTQAVSSNKYIIFPFHFSIEF